MIHDGWLPVASGDNLLHGREFRYFIILTTIVPLTHDPVGRRKARAAMRSASESAGERYAPLDCPCLHAER
jgi:hypothetical protein